MASKMLFYHGCLVYINRGKDADGEMTTGFEATGENGLVIAGGFYNRKMTDNEILRELEIVLADRAVHPEDYESGVSSDSQKEE
jgi:hypothetical protein